MVGFIGLFNGFLHLFKSLFLLFDGFLEILLGFLRSGFLILGFTKLLFNFGKVFFGEFLHAVESLGHFLHGVGVEVTITTGVLEKLFHLFGDVFHFLGILLLGVLALGELALGVLFLQLFGSFLLVETFVCVEVVHLASGGVFQLSDDSVELVFEKLGMFVTSQDIDNDGFGIDTPSSRFIIFGVGRKHQLLWGDFVGGRREDGELAESGC